MAKHNNIGAWGEEMARQYLIKNDYAIYEQNSRIGHKELDIIAFKGNRIVFVEVKTRSTDLSDPLDAIDEKKIRLITRAADTFLRSHNITHEPQFDVITVVGSPESEYQLTHYPDAFFAPFSGCR